MKTISIYQCDHCGFETRNFGEIEKHEAAHFGLSVKDKHIYDAMLSFQYFLNSLPEDKDKVKKSKIEIEQKLIKFEREHGLIRKRVKFKTVKNSAKNKSLSNNIHK